LIDDELIEIGVGEHAPHALLAVADGHIRERAGINVAVERLDRAAELGRRLGLRAQSIGRASADGPRLARGLYGRGVDAESFLGRCKKVLADGTRSVR
jgi:hypothetical protein